MKRAEKVEHLLDVATELFCRQGYHATGIDQIIAESKIAKTTLYRHFKSKDELIVAVLRRIDERYRLAMRNKVDAEETDSKKKLLATFDYLEQWFNSKEFFGCPFMSAAAEFHKTGHPVFQEALMHKRLVTAYFEELARAAKLHNPTKLAEEVNLLHEGATAISHITREARIAMTAKAAAARLIDCHDEAS